MKRVAISNDWGAGFFGPPDFIFVQRGLDADKAWGLTASEIDETRTWPEFLAWIERANRTEYKIVEIPDNAHFQIFDYDGVETLYWSESEIHSTR